MLNPNGKVIWTPVDIWMLGVIGYIMKFGAHPFAKNRAAIMNYDIEYP